MLPHKELTEEIRLAISPEYHSPCATAAHRSYVDAVVHTSMKAMAKHFMCDMEDRRDAVISDIFMCLRMMAKDDLSLSNTIIDAQRKFEGKPELPPQPESKINSWYD